MIQGLLYNRSDKTLRELDAKSVIASMPTAEEARQSHENAQREAENGEPDPAARRQKSQCRQGELMWIDICDPTNEDYDLIAQRFALHSMVVEDIKSREGRPKLHDYNDYLYIIFHALDYGIRAETDDDKGALPGKSAKQETVSDAAPDAAPVTAQSAPPQSLVPTKTPARAEKVPARASAEKQDEAQPERFMLNVTEIDCLVGKDYVVTLHDGKLKPFEDLRGRWMRNPQLMESGAGHLLYELMDEVLDEYFPLLDSLDERIDDFEDRLFAQWQENLSADIFSLKRSLLQIRRIAGPTRDVVNILMRHDADTGGRHFAYFQDLYDHSSRIVDSVDNFRDLLSGALDAYLAIASNRMNAIMKTLTSVSIILLIPTLIAGIYGMNFENMPELHTRYGYFVALGVMATIIVSLTIYFRRNDWL